MINVASNFCKVLKSLEYLLNLINTNSSRSYQKPATGIPASDLALSVLNDLSKVIETTYNELKSLRDNSQLIPGCWYRITDYECTTTQEDTRSAGHIFDILVLATSTNTLSEEARAIQHNEDYDGVFVDDGDHYVYTGKKVIVHFEDITKELYFWHFVTGSNYEGFYSELSLEELKSLTQEQLNETLWVYSDTDSTSENEISIQYLYNDRAATLSERGLTYSFDSYFSKCNLNAWKIWYCLDNDINRFAWADSTNGKGVIYRMIDEWNNDCPYDFKNIQFLSGEDFLYTFSYENKDASMLNNDDSDYCYNNVIKPCGWNHTRYLNFICLLHSDDIEDPMVSNTFESDCYLITLEGASYNFFNTCCHDIKLLSWCSNNYFEPLVGYIIMSGGIYACHFMSQANYYQSTKLIGYAVLFPNHFGEGNLNNMTFPDNIMFIGFTSNGLLKVWNPADLVPTT